MKLDYSTVRPQSHSISRTIPFKAQPHQLISTKDKENNGQFNTDVAAKNFIRGVFSPVTAIFSSVKNLAATAGIITVSTLLMSATAGRIAPLFVTLGALSSGVSIFKTIKNFVNAKTPDEKEKCFYGAGSAISESLMTIAGAKSSLESAKIPAKELNTLNALVKNVTETPKIIMDALETIKSGAAAKRVINLITLKRPVVAIIDGFGNPNVLINDKMRSSHGNMVEKFIKVVKQDAKTIKFPSKNSFQTITRLEQLEKLLESGKRIDYLNMSLGVFAKVDDLAKLTGLPLTKENLIFHKEAIIAALRTQPKYKNAVQIMDILERIKSKFPVDIRLCAGNDGPDCVNIYALGKGIKSVTSLTPKGSVFWEHANHSLVTDKAQGIFGARKLYDNNGKLLGYNITGGKTVQVPVSVWGDDVSSFEKFVGKNLKDVIAPDEIHLNLLKDGLIGKEGIQLPPSAENLGYDKLLFSSERLLDIAKNINFNNSEVLDFLESIKGSYIQSSSNLNFIEENGKVVYKILGLRVPNDAGAILIGTSYASPFSVGNDAKINFPSMQDAVNHLKKIAPEALTINSKITD